MRSRHREARARKLNLDWDIYTARVQAEIDRHNANPTTENFYGRPIPQRARVPIIATDCDYEIVTISGVQGKCLTGKEETVLSA